MGDSVARLDTQCKRLDARRVVWTRNCVPRWTNCVHTQYSSEVARYLSPPPNEFARLVTDAIKRELGVLGWSGRELARQLEKSEGYVRERLKYKFEFSLNDIEDFCLLIGMQPDAFIARIEADESFRQRFIAKANVGPSTEDEGHDEDYDVDLVPKSDLGLAANRGTRKTDVPHAE